MNKKLLAEAVAKRLGVTHHAGAAAVDAVLDTIVREVTAGGRVSVTGFGSFAKVDCPARYARNPQTGERVRVKKTSIPRFRAGQGFKDLVAGSKKLPKNDIAVKKAPKRHRDPQTGELVAPLRKKATAAKKTASKRTTARATTVKKTASKRTTTKKAAAKRTVNKTAAAKKATAAKRTSTKK
jgi:DNA-binding protein HU-beta